MNVNAFWGAIVTKLARIGGSGACRRIGDGVEAMLIQHGTSHAPLLASRMPRRREPGPASAAVVTTKVLAVAVIAVTIREKA